MPHFPVLSAIIFVPLLGGLAALACRQRPMLCRWLSLAAALVDLALVGYLFLLGLQPQFGPTGRWLWIEDTPWIAQLGIRYTLGLDGISLVLILLAAFLTVICVLISWREIDSKVASYHFFLLTMCTCIQGVFLATNLFLFYLFWEVQVIPMYFLVGIWGHENRIYATIKFILFTIAGSLLMLIALIGLYFVHGSQTGTYTFALYPLLQTTLSPAAEIWIYAAFLLAFAIKIPVVPVHTWLPDAHTEAPTAGSVILAGLLLKAGLYALIRFGFPLFPMAARLSVPLLVVIGLIGLFYAAWIALAQTDLKRLVAYSSIAHMGLIVIGVAVWSRITLSGAVLQMINHGLTTSALFIVVGMLDERTHSRKFADLGGIWGKMPVYSGFFLFFAMAALGLPGLNNFVGELLILVGTFVHQPVVAITGFAGLVLTLIYVVRMVQSTLFVEARKAHHLWDVTPREVLALTPLVIGILYLGLYPTGILDLLQGSITDLLNQFPSTTVAQVVSGAQLQ
jgi:NADH-quinone oxidoreductase subunit M